MAISLLFSLIQFIFEPSEDLLFVGETILLVDGETTVIFTGVIFVGDIPWVGEGGMLELVVPSSSMAGSPVIVSSFSSRGSMLLLLELPVDCTVLVVAIECACSFIAWIFCCSLAETTFSLIK